MQSFKAADVLVTGIDVSCSQHLMAGCINTIVSHRLREAIVIQPRYKTAVGYSNILRFQRVKTEQQAKKKRIKFKGAKPGCSHSHKFHLNV